jgi:hypothetical protein
MGSSRRFNGGDLVHEEDSSGNRAVRQIEQFNKLRRQEKVILTYSHVIHNESDKRNSVMILLLF